jgi:hypothetical protein
VIREWVNTQGLIAREENFTAIGYFPEILKNIKSVIKNC